jgi:alkylated DNA repair protein (DNA oxidative demethylase)
MAAQLSLFEAPAEPMAMIADEIVTPPEEAELIARIDALDLAPFRFQGWLGKRLTKSFGWSYDFEDGRFARADPIPDWLEPLRASVARYAQIPCDTLVQALLIRYDPGAGIGWHKDRPVFEDVIGVSLGAPATMRLRRRTAEGWQRASLPLAPRSAYHLAGAVRHEWEHSIVPMEAARWSITFRALSDRGRALL